MKYSNVMKVWESLQEGRVAVNERGESLYLQYLLENNELAGLLSGMGRDSNYIVDSVAAVGGGCKDSKRAFDVGISSGVLDSIDSSGIRPQNDVNSHVEALAETSLQNLDSKNHHRDLAKDSSPLAQNDDVDKSQNDSMSKCQNDNADKIENASKILNGNIGSVHNISNVYSDNISHVEGKAPNISWDKASLDSKSLDFSTIESKSASGATFGNKAGVESKNGEAIIRKCFDFSYYTKNVDSVFKRVFG